MAVMVPKRTVVGYSASCQCATLRTRWLSKEFSANKYQYSYEADSSVRQSLEFLWLSVLMRLKYYAECRGRDWTNYN